MSTMASQNTNFAIVYSTAYSGADQRKHQRSTSLAFLEEIHWWPVNSPHKGPVTRKMFPFDDVILWYNVCKVHVTTALDGVWNGLRLANHKPCMWCRRSRLDFWQYCLSREYQWNDDLVFRFMNMRKSILQPIATEWAKWRHKDMSQDWLK